MTRKKIMVKMGLVEAVVVMGTVLPIVEMNAK